MFQMLFIPKRSMKQLPKVFQTASFFRSAREVRGAATRHMPPTERSIGLFWNAAMDELEKRLRSEGLDIQLVLNRNEHGQAQEVLYTPHSLRVAGLTSLAEQGVPIEVLSKLVAGHKSILMTIYYIKHDYAHITEVLNEASHKTLLESQESFSRWIKEELGIRYLSMLYIIMKSQLK